MPSVPSYEPLEQSFAEGCCLNQGHRGSTLPAPTLPPYPPEGILIKPSFPTLRKINTWETAETFSQGVFSFAFGTNGSLERSILAGEVRAWAARAHFEKAGFPLRHAYFKHHFPSWLYLKWGSVLGGFKRGYSRQGAS